jgi:hypothetical protein
LSAARNTSRQHVIEVRDDRAVEWHVESRDVTQGRLLAPRILARVDDRLLVDIVVLAMVALADQPVVDPVVRSTRLREA